MVIELFYNEGLIHREFILIEQLLFNSGFDIDILKRLRDLICRKIPYKWKNG